MARIAFSPAAADRGQARMVLEIGCEYPADHSGRDRIRICRRVIRPDSRPRGQLLRRASISLRARSLSTRRCRIRTSSSGPISGDIAARTGWAPRIDHIVSIGGLHPRYPAPQTCRTSGGCRSISDRTIRASALGVRSDNTRTRFSSAQVPSSTRKVRRFRFVGVLAAEGSISSTRSSTSIHSPSKRR